MTAETSSELGDLKLEQTITDGFVIRSKFYAITDGIQSVCKQCEGKGTYEDEQCSICGGLGKIEGKCKIKGVALRIPYLKFKGFLEKPTASYTKFAKFKKCLRRGLYPNQIIPIDKTMTLEDDKHDWADIAASSMRERSFDMDGWQKSTPLKLENGQCINGAEYREKIRDAIERYQKKHKIQLNEMLKSDLYDQLQDVRDRDFDEWFESEVR
jgi:predicted amidophosphoribosyltransferase